MKIVIIDQAAFDRLPPDDKSRVWYLKNRAKDPVHYLTRRVPWLLAVLRLG